MGECDVTPKPEVRTAQGKKMLLDDVLGTGFALLRLSDQREAAFASLRSDTWQRAGVRFVSIENEISDFMLNRRDLFILVRPDRYVCGVFKEERADAFAAAFPRETSLISKRRFFFKLIEPTPVFSVSTAYEAANYRATPTFAQLPAAAAGRSLDSGSMRFLGCHQGRTRRVHSQRHHAHHLKRPVER